jgi:hypothetical protein
MRLRCFLNLRQKPDTCPPRAGCLVAGQVAAMDSAPPVRHAALAIMGQRWLLCVRGGYWWSKCR